MKNCIYQKYIGKNKKDIIKEIGDQFNVPYEKIWTYHFRITVLFKLEVIFIFDEEGTVTSVYCKKLLRFL